MSSNWLKIFKKRPSIMNLSVKIIAQVVCLMAIASAGALAIKCDFHYSRNTARNLTRIQVNDKLVAIQNHGQATWKAIVMSGASLNVSDETGSSKSIPFPEVPIDLWNQFSLITHDPFTANVVKSQAGQVSISWDRTSEPLGITFSDKDTFSIKGEDLLASVRANIKPETKSDLEYTAVFYQDNSIVTLVDPTCSKVEVLPYQEVSAEIRKVISSLAWRLTSS